MPQQFGIVPCRLARRADAPGSDRILQVRHRRERVSEKTNVQRAFRGFDEAVERGVERSVVVVLDATVLRNGRSDLASGGDCLGKIVIDMSVDPR